MLCIKLLWWTMFPRFFVQMATIIIQSEIKPPLPKGTLYFFGPIIVGCCDIWIKMSFLLLRQYVARHLRSRNVTSSKSDG